MVDVGLCATLPRLALIVLFPEVLLGLLVAGEGGGGTAEGAGDAIAHALAQIAQLALRLLASAGAVLLDAFALQSVGAEGVAQHLLAGAHGLVPRAFGALRVVLCQGARRGAGEGAQLGGRVGEVVFGFALGALLLALSLSVMAQKRARARAGGVGRQRTLSASLPVREPRRDWAAPEALSSTDCRVEVSLSDMAGALDGGR